MSDALRLSESESAYLLALTGRAANLEVSEPNPLLAEALQAIAFPAYLVTASWDSIDCNRPFRRVWGISDDEIPFNAVERIVIQVPDHASQNRLALAFQSSESARTAWHQAGPPARRMR